MRTPFVLLPLALAHDGGSGGAVHLVDAHSCPCDVINASPNKLDQDNTASRNSRLPAECASLHILSGSTWMGLELGQLARMGA